MSVKTDRESSYSIHQSNHYESIELLKITLKRCKDSITVFITGERCSFFFLTSSFTSCVPFLTHEPTSASTGARGLYMEVKMVLKKVLYDPLKRVLSKTRVEAVNFSISI